MRDTKDTTVAMFDAIGITSFKNNTNAHVNIINVGETLACFSPWANLIISNFYLKSNKNIKKKGKIRKVPIR